MTDTPAAAPVAEKVTVPVITRFVVVEFTGEERWVNLFTKLLKEEVDTTIEFMDALYEGANGGKKRDPTINMIKVYDRRQD